MHTRTQRLINRSFGSAVFQPAQPLREAELEREIPISTIESTPATAAPFETNTRVRSILLSRLMATNPSDTLSEERDKLLSEANTFGSAVDAFLDACAEQRHAMLEKRHKEVRALGREQTALCGQLTVKFNVANADWNHACEARAHAVDDLKGARYQKAHLGRWASDSEINKADANVANAKTKADRAIEKENEALQRRNEAEEVLLVAKAKLNELATEEIRLRHSLDGRPYVDSETGLTVA